MAIVAAYNFDALLESGALPDKAAYGRDLTVDAGVALVEGHSGMGLSCTSGGASRAYVVDDYMAAGSSFSCFAWVKTTSATAARRVLASITRGTSYVASLLLSDAAGYVAIAHGDVGSPVIYSSGVSIRDGQWHQVGCAVNTLLSTPTWTIWVDGVVVASGTATSTISNANGIFSVGRDHAGAGIAGAVIDDVRWFNDPVYEAEASLFFGPVSNLVVAAYNFDAGSGATVADQTLRHNDLTLTSNGEWITGHDGSALSPIAAGNPAAAGTELELYDGTFDRLSVAAWVKVIRAGSAAPFLSLEDEAGVPVFQLFKGGANGLLFKAWGGSTWPFLDGNYRFGADGVLSDTEWRFIHVNINPTGFAIQVWGPTGTVIDDYQDNTFGTPPTNLPIIENVHTMRVGGAVGSGGAVAVDDLRLIRNYLNPLALATLRTSHVTPEPVGVITAEAHFTGSGVFTAPAIPVHEAAAEFTGTGLFSAPAVPVIEAPAFFTGAGLFSAPAYPVHEGSGLTARVRAGIVTLDVAAVAVRKAGDTVPVVGAAIRQGGATIPLA